MASKEGNVPATTESGVVFPSENLDALLDLARFLELHTEPALLLGPDGEQAPLPEEIYRILVNAETRAPRPASSPWILR